MSVALVLQVGSRERRRFPLSSCFHHGASPDRILPKGRAYRGPPSAQLDPIRAEALPVSFRSFGN